MDQFGDIFTPPDSPNPNYNPHENMLRHIQDIDEAERRSTHTKQFMNLLNEAEEGNISVTGEIGATGGPAPTLPSCVSQLMLTWPMFKLSMNSSPLTCKTLHHQLHQNGNILRPSLMNITNLNAPAKGFVLGQCVISKVGRQKPACSLFGPDLMGKIFMRASICHPIRPMISSW